MALLTVEFKSAVLGHETPLNIILPETCPEEDIPTVFLLHGMHGDHSSWCRKTSIERYAYNRGLAVVMPDGENGFYTDMKYGKKHYTYASEEVVDYTRRILRLSRRRERTFVCGLSMGGYGAFKLGLSKPETFSAAASLSGSLDIASHFGEEDWRHDAEMIWGEDCDTSFPSGESDLFALLGRFSADPALPRPRLYAACGTEDYLFPSNEKFRLAASSSELEFRYETDRGAHTWAFWDKYVTHALDFFLEKL